MQSNYVLDVEPYLGVLCSGVCAEAPTVFITDASLSLYIYMILLCMLFQYEVVAYIVRED